MKKFSVLIAGQHATSISLEEEFYSLLVELAKEQKTPLNALITKIDNSRKNKNLSSALRIYVLQSLIHKIKHLEQI